MKNTALYEGNVVELKKDVKGTSESTTFTLGEIDVITTININTTSDTTGIEVVFVSGKVLNQQDATNYSSWLHRHFKLTI
jgi:hypothetical protein